MRTVREIARQSGAGKYQGVYSCPDSRPSLRGAFPRLPDARRHVYGVILVVSLMLPLTTELPLLSAHNPDQSEAIRRLSRVFGIDRVPLHFRHRAPPQFMTELYRRVTDSGGLTKTYTPYHADTVRSLPDKSEYITLSKHARGRKHSQTMIEDRAIGTLNIATMGSVVVKQDSLTLQNIS